jgi:hypothetical protein
VSRHKPSPPPALRDPLSLAIANDIHRLLAEHPVVVELNIGHAPNPEKYLKHLIERPDIAQPLAILILHRAEAWGSHYKSANQFSSDDLGRLHYAALLLKLTASTEGVASARTLAGLLKDSFGKEDEREPLRKGALSALKSFIDTSDGDSETSPRQ